mgnify:CR=1 FL=1
MTDEYLDDASFNNMLAEPLRLYEHALSIWNHTGLNYQALSVEAKDISTTILRQSIDLFESLKNAHLSLIH